MNYDSWRTSEDVEPDAYESEDHKDARKDFEDLLDASYTTEKVPTEFIESKLWELSEYFGVSLPKGEIKIKREIEDEQRE